MAIKNIKIHRLLVLIKSQQNSLKQEEEKFALTFINLIIIFGISRNCLRSGRSRSFIYKMGDRTDFSNYRRISLLPTTYKILSNFLLSRLTQYAEEIMGHHQCGFRRSRSNIYHIFSIRQILEKNGNTTKQRTSTLYTSRTLMIPLGGRSCIIFSLEFGIPMKLVTLIKMCLIETYSRGRVGKKCLTYFLLGMVRNKEILYRHSFSTLFWSAPLRGFW